MTEVLAGTELDVYLAEIRRVFENYDFRRFRNMIFMSADSFFSFIDLTTGPGPLGGFKDIIDGVEPFIPLVVSEDELELYMLACLEEDEDALAAIQEQFAANSKIKFVKSVFAAGGVSDLERIFDICRAIRDYKIMNDPAD